MSGHCTPSRVPKTGEAGSNDRPLSHLEEMTMNFENLPSREAISPIRAIFRDIGVRHCADEDTRRYWRKVWKRNRGRKVKSLRTHRSGK